MTKNTMKFEDQNKDKKTGEAEKAPVTAPSERAVYSRDVNQYFKDFKEAPDPDTAGYYSEIARSLERLGDPKSAERMQPTDVALALSELSGHMATLNPDIESNLDEDPKIQAENERKYLQAKKLFLESGRRIYPDVKIEANDVPSQLYSVINRLKTTDALVPAMNMTEISKLLKNDPEKLAEEIDSMLYGGDVMRDKAFTTYSHAGDSESAEAEHAERTRGELAVQSEALYKLQIMRDILQQKIYQGPEVRPSDARKIDELRKELEGANDRKPAEGAEERVLTAQEKTLIGKMEQAVEGEKASERNAATRGNTFGRGIQPAVEGFRAVWQDDGALARRLTFLETQAKTIAKSIMDDGKRKDPELARFDALKETFLKLTPAERKALEDASERETSRQREETSRRPGGMTGAMKREPQTLFIDLLNRLK